MFRGIEGMREFWSAYRTDLDDMRVEMEEIRDLGDDVMLYLGTYRWRGPASGVEVESRLGMIFTVRDGKIVRSIDYLSHHEALQAVGLRE